jgi:hypothetical protein
MVDTASGTTSSEAGSDNSEVIGNATPLHSESPQTSQQESLSLLSMLELDPLHLSSPEGSQRENIITADPCVEELKDRTPPIYQHFTQLCLNLKQNVPLKEFLSCTIYHRTLHLGVLASQFTDEQWARFGKALKANTTLRKLVFDGMKLGRVAMEHLVGGLTENRGPYREVIKNHTIKKIDYFTHRVKLVRYKRKTVAVHDRINEVVFNNCRVDKEGWRNLQDSIYQGPLTVKCSGKITFTHPVLRRQRKTAQFVQSVNAAPPMLLSPQSNSHRSRGHRAPQSQSHPATQSLRRQQSHRKFK